MIEKREYNDKKYPYQDEVNQIIGICIDVHKILGKGFLEVVYKDAMEIEFKKANIPFEREKEYKIIYKGVQLNHNFYADFVVMNKIIIEVKAQKNIIEEFGKQIINYLAVSKCKLGVIINFGEDIIKVKKYIL